jgi:hypothetical protein
MNPKQCIGSFQGKELTKKEERIAKNRLKKVMLKGNSQQVAKEALKVLAGLE